MMLLCDYHVMMKEAHNDTGTPQPLSKTKKKLSKTKKKHLKPVHPYLYINL